MKFKYAGTWIAPGGKSAAFDISVNGQPVLQVVPVLRAAATRVFGGDNKTDPISFSVRIPTESYRLAERAMLGQLAWLPGRGQLEAYCGVEGDEEVFYLAAGLRGVERSTSGVMTRLRYNFTGGLWTTDGTTVIPEEGDVKRNKVNLTAGDLTKAIVFAPALANPPVVVNCWIVPPDGGEFIDARPLKSSITAEGFTAVLGAEIPDAGYELHWTAVV